MAVTIEVCVDNIESLITAQQAGADRIELCSALSLGGITPNAGFVQKALDLSNVPVYAMIRPRAGDFVFSTAEIDIMISDIKFFKLLGIDGVVIGALTANGDIDEVALSRLMCAARDIGVTFHRAFDLCRNPQQALETLINAGCERVLTSGQQASAEQGKALIQELVKQADKRINIMPGAGINAGNAAMLVDDTAVIELHLSGKTRRPSKMQTTGQLAMGNSQDSDNQLDVTCGETISQVSRAVNPL